MERPLVLLDAGNPGGLTREVLAPRQAWTRPPAEFLLDLADRPIPPWLRQAARERHGVERLHFGPALVYGSHHFHAVLDVTHVEAVRLAVQESLPGRARFRMKYHLGHPPPGDAPVPRISGPEDAWRIDFSPVPPESVSLVPGPAFFASPTEPDNWGMWLLSLLPGIADWQARGGQEKLLCWCRQDWQRNLLRFLGVPDGMLVPQPEWRVFACPELTLHQYSAVDLIPTPGDIEVFNRIGQACGQPAAHGKLFVSRKAFTARLGIRRLMNEDALIAAMEARGFHILDPETLPFDAQVRLFRGARIVVGLGGAAMFNTVFCAPGTQVVSIESTTQFADQHASLFASLGHRYGFIFGTADPADPAPEHKRWTIDVDRAVAQIDSFTRG